VTLSEPAIGHHTPHAGRARETTLSAQARPSDFWPPAGRPTKARQAADGKPTRVSSNRASEHQSIMFEERIPPKALRDNEKRERGKKGRENLARRRGRPAARPWGDPVRRQAHCLRQTIPGCLHWPAALPAALDRLCRPSDQPVEAPLEAAPSCDASLVYTSNNRTDHMGACPAALALAAQVADLRNRCVA